MTLLFEVKIYEAPSALGKNRFVAGASDGHIRAGGDPLSHVALGLLKRQETVVYIFYGQQSCLCELRAFSQ